MAERRKLIAGNWKMNGLRAGAMALAGALAARMRAEKAPAFDMVICPPATLIYPIGDVVAGSRIELGGQDCHPQEKGAFTGDISAAMLKNVGCSHVVVGHSERRAGHHESSALVAAKAACAHRSGLVTIICFGESEAERAEGRHEAVVSDQLAQSLPEGATAANTVLAYEPVWAIGTGKTATSADIAAMHAHVRAQLKGRIDDPAAARILYGGSVKPGNAPEILALADVDGVLVGGASLEVEDFWAIAQAVG